MYEWIYIWELIVPHTHGVQKVSSVYHTLSAVYHCALFYFTNVGILHYEFSVQSLNERVADQLLLVFMTAAIKQRAWCTCIIYTWFVSSCPSYALYIIHVYACNMFKVKSSCAFDMKLFLKILYSTLNTLKQPLICNTLDYSLLRKTEIYLPKKFIYFSGIFIQPFGSSDFFLVWVFLDPRGFIYVPK